MPEIKYERPNIESLPDRSLPGKKVENVPRQTEERPASDEQPSLKYLPNTSASDQTPRLNLRRKVEDTLSDGLESIYLDMDAGTQAKFRQKGEETSRKIADLMQRGKATLKKVLQLIIDWLKIIPGVNKHFLEQEAKIRADQVMKIQNK